MKMFYIKPEIDIEIVEVESFLANSDGEGTTPITDEPVIDTGGDDTLFDTKVFSW